MRRVLEESSEVYEVTGAEICMALGIQFYEVDSISLTQTTGGKYQLKVKANERVDVEIAVPDNRPREHCAWDARSDTPIGFLPVRHEDGCCD
jgi:hypothetical protein